MSAGGYPSRWTISRPALFLPRNLVYLVGLVSPGPYELAETIDGLTEEPRRNHLALRRNPGRMPEESYPASQSSWHFVWNQIIHSKQPEESASAEQG